MIKFLWRRRTTCIFLVPLALLFVARPTPELFWFGLPMVFAGVAVRIWSAGYLTKLSDLVTAGPFALCRNPLYIGSFLVCLGYLVMCNSLIAWLITLPLFWLFHGGAVAYEEKLLNEKFGQPFADYCKGVPRLLPKIGSMSGNGHFSFSQVKYNREYSGLTASVVVVLLFALVAFKLHQSFFDLVVMHFR